jgi:hypothetical protein
VADKQFKVGDKVRLTSGSIRLTIVDLDPKSVVVAWRHAGKVDEAVLPRAMVKLDRAQA